MIGSFQNTSARRLSAKLRSLFSKPLGLLALSVIAFAAASAVNAAPNIDGRWRTPDKAVIDITACGSSPCGKLISFRPLDGQKMDTARDIRHRDTSKRSRKLVGLTVLWQLAPHGNLWRGRIYDPRRGFSAAATLRLLSPDQMEVTGCVRAVLKICKNETWIKLK